MLVEPLPVLLELQSLSFTTEGMVGEKPFHVPASTCEMSQLYATSLPADYYYYGKTSCKRKRGSLAKGARNCLAGREEESLSLNSIAHLISENGS